MPRFSSKVAARVTRAKARLRRKRGVPSAANAGSTSRTATLATTTTPRPAAPCPTYQQLHAHIKELTAAAENMARVLQTIDAGAKALRQALDYPLWQALAFHERHKHETKINHG